MSRPPTTAKLSDSQIAARSGRILCEAMPVTASSTERRSEYLVAPCLRAPGRYGMVVSEYPNQRTTPRRNSSWSWRQARLMAEVAGERHVAHDRVARGCADCFERAIGAAILDENDLIAAEWSEQLLEHRAHWRDVLRLVVGGDNDRDVGSRISLWHDQSLTAVVRTEGRDLHSG